MEQTPASSIDVHTSGMSMTQADAMDRSLALWSGFLSDDMAEFEADLRSARGSASAADLPVSTRGVSPVAAAAPEGDGAPEETGVRRGSYSPPRIRLGASTREFRYNSDENQRVRYHEGAVAFGVPPWGFLPAPDDSQNFEGIRGIWSANFDCAYPDDYLNDDVRGKYGLTIGSGCRPRSNRQRYRWAHVLVQNDEADFVRPSVQPVHRAQEGHPIAVPGRDEDSYCRQQEEKRGSCSFGDHGVAQATYRRTDGSGNTMTTPGTAVFQR